MYKTQVEFRSHFSGGKNASYGPRNMVIPVLLKEWTQLCFNNIVYLELRM